MQGRMRGRRAGSLLLIAVIGPLLAACTLAPGGLTSTYQCADWADLSDPQLAFDTADAVVIGTPAASHATVPMLGVDAAVHEVSVRDVLKGDVAPDSTIEVASTPASCGDGEPYPDGDPLGEETELLLYLTTPSALGVRGLVNPYQGAGPVPDAGDLPSAG
ncbi:hypothetical protein [Brachybacterium phenoliresistens]|nr:hypothetical protein [Brachybacterium phenoliresistens]